MSNVTTQCTIQEICFEDGVQSVIHIFMLLSLICTIRYDDDGKIIGGALGALYKKAFEMCDKGVQDNTIRSAIYVMYTRISQSCYN